MAERWTDETVDLVAGKIAATYSLVFDYQTQKPAIYESHRVIARSILDGLADAGLLASAEVTP